MATTWIKTILLLFILTGCKHEPAYRIYGTVGDRSCDSAKIYLVPAIGPRTSETVDSAYVVDGKFYFEGIKEQMSILRMGIRYRLNRQDLLVVTEPGIIRAHIDTISSAAGTPQNDQLQRWKEHREQGMTELSARRKAWRDSRSAADSLRFRLATDSLWKEEQEFTYRLLLEEGDNTLGRFLYRLRRSSLTEEQQARLDSIIPQKKKEEQEGKKE